MCVSIFPVCKSACVMSACGTNYAKPPTDRLHMSKKILTKVPTQSVPGRRHSPAQVRLHNRFESPISELKKISNYRFYGCIAVNCVLYPVLLFWANPTTIAFFALFHGHWMAVFWLLDAIVAAPAALDFTL